MDYYECPQIGGYRIEMPFPQLFYPEINSIDKSFNQYACSDSVPLNVSDSAFQSNFLDSGCEQDGEFSHDRYNISHTAMPNTSSLRLRESPLQRDFFDYGCKDCADMVRDGCDMGCRPRPPSNQSGPFAYRSYISHCRRAREMLLRNGLNAPSDSQEKRGMYPPYKGDPHGKLALWDFDVVV